MLRVTTIGMIVVAAISTVVIFLGGSMVFPPMEMPPMSLLPAFMFLSFWDALAFGVGIALLIYLALNYTKWPKEIRGSLLVLFFIALWFSVLNWVHDGLHESGAAAPNFQLLAVTEYVFHFPWLIFALALVVVAARLGRIYARHEVR
jgi:hypothetical protein